MIKTRTLSNLATFLALLVMFFSIAVIRYPIYLSVPNFYAEDGTVFFQSSMDKGLFGILDPFNGYPILGIRLMSLIAYYLSFYPLIGNIQAVAIANAIVSMMFWSMLAVCTLFVLRRYVDRYLGILGSILIVLLPLNGWNYAILGTLGNMKFGFVYLSFLLWLSRCNSGKWTTANKLGYLICFLTNPISVIFLPFFLLTNKANVFAVKMKDFIYSVTILILAFVIIFSAQNHDLPKDYTSGKWSFSQMAEVLVLRTLFFQFSSGIYQFFNVSLVLIVLTLLAVAIIKLKSGHGNIAILGFFFSTVISIIILVTRGGLSSFYEDFKDPGPAQFFYPQNMIAMTSTVILFGGSNLYRNLNFNTRKLLVASVLLTHLIFNFEGIGFLGKGVNGTWQAEQGSIRDNLKQLCVSHPSGIIDVPIMPGNPWVISIPREDVCGFDASP